MPSKNLSITLPGLIRRTSYNFRHGRILSSLHAFHLWHIIYFHQSPLTPPAGAIQSNTPSKPEKQFKLHFHPSKLHSLLLHTIMNAVKEVIAVPNSMQILEGSSFPVFPIWHFHQPYHRLDLKTVAPRYMCKFLLQRTNINCHLEQWLSSLSPGKLPITWRNMYNFNVSWNLYKIRQSA